MFTKIEKIYRCNHISTEFVGHLIYELSVNDNTNQTIENMINRSLVNSLDNEKAKCPICKLESEYSTNTYLMETPKYLIILLKRYTFDRERKQIKKINVPIKSGRYDIQSDDVIIQVEGITYKLLSTIVHKGPIPTQGHYFTFMKQNGQYYEVNDQNVHEIEGSKIKISNESYILLYEKT